MGLASDSTQSANEQDSDGDEMMEAGGGGGGGGSTTTTASGTASMSRTMLAKDGTLPLRAYTPAWPVTDSDQIRLQIVKIELEDDGRPACLTGWRI